jgi:hypothetical protein
MIYLDANDLVYSKDPSQGVTSAGFSVDSIMMKIGISPIRTMNTSDPTKEEDVASLFKNKLVVPNWLLSFPPSSIPPSFSGGNGNKEHQESKDMYGDEEDVMDDDLHDRLLDLVKEHDAKQSKKKRMTRKDIKRSNKKTKKQKHV